MVQTLPLVIPVRLRVLNGDLAHNQQNRKGAKFFIRVVPLDNFMIYNDIIRLDRPD